MTDAQVRELLRPTIARVAAELRARHAPPTDPATFAAASGQPLRIPTPFTADEAHKFADYFAADDGGHYPGAMHRKFGMGLRGFAEATGLRRKQVAGGKWAWVGRAGKAFADAPAEPAPGRNAALADAALRVADECYHHGTDPGPGLEALRELVDDPDAWGDETETFAAFASKYDESKHPRDDRGRYVSRDAIHEAAANPEKAKELRAKVTDPEQRKKLDAAIENPAETVGRTKKGQQRHEAGQRRTDREATRKRVAEITSKVLLGDSTAEDLHELIDHLQSGHLTRENLTNARIKLGAKFGAGKSPRHEQMVEALVRHARRAILDHRIEEHGLDREEMEQAAGVGGAKEEEKPENKPAIGIGSPVAADTLGGETHTGRLVEVDNGTAIIEKPDGTTHATPVEALREPEPDEEVNPLGVRVGDTSREIPPATPTAPGVSVNDIPYQVAYDAHRNSSFVPERRAKQRQNEYVEQMNADWAHLSKFAKTPEQLEQLKAEFERYKDGYRQHTLAVLGAASRTASSMITGPAGFPTERNRKRLETEHRRITELIEFRQRALKAIQKKIAPEDGAIQSNNPQAVELLRKELETHQKRQELYKKINDAHKKFLKDPASLDSSDLSDESKNLVRNYKPEYSWEPHPIPPYRIQNNGANMRRIQGRIEQLQKLRETPHSEQQYTGGVKVVEDPEAARIRVHFPGKPDKATIDKLKAGGFRWSPSEGAWQRHLNNGGRYAVEQTLKGLGHTKVEAAAPAGEQAPAESEVPPMIAAPEPEPDLPEDAAGLFDTPQATEPAAASTSPAGAVAEPEKPAAGPKPPAWAKSDPELAGVVSAYHGAPTPRGREVVENALLNAGYLKMDKDGNPAGWEKEPPEDGRERLAKGLAAAYRDAHGTGDHAAAESALRSLGAEPVGEPGEAATFDGATQEHVAGLFTGHPVKVVRPGWVLPGAGGSDRVLVKAKVEPAGKSVPNGKTGVDEPLPTGNNTPVEPPTSGGGAKGGGKVEPISGREKRAADGYGVRVEADPNGGYQVVIDNGKGKKGTVPLDATREPAPYFRDALKKVGANPRDYRQLGTQVVRADVADLVDAAAADYRRELAAKRAGGEAALHAAVPGLKELRAARDAAELHGERFGRMMEDESNDGARPPAPPTGPSPAELAAKYPRAALYMRAEDYSLASHDRKASAGKRAMQMIRDGASEEDVRKVLENWLPDSAFDN